jgi:predicted site-specific integrase-resolvase
MSISNMNANSNQTANQLLYSRRDAAKILGGVSDTTIDSWIRSGHLKPTRVVGRVFIHQEELARIAKQGAGQ